MKSIIKEDLEPRAFSTYIIAHTVLQQTIWGGGGNQKPSRDGARKTNNTQLAPVGKLAPSPRPRITTQTGQALPLTSNLIGLNHNYGHRQKAAQTVCGKHTDIYVG